MAGATAMVAVVTGSSGGLGGHLAAQLAADGWDLVMLNRSRDRSAAVLRACELARPGGRYDVVEVDLAEVGSIRAAATTVLEGWPRVGALFNNAGVLLGAPAYASSGIDLHAQVNLLAPYALTRLLAPALIGGVVVNTGSSAMFRAKDLDLDALARPERFVKLFGPYARSKLALASMTAALAAEGSAATLRTVEPGANKTAMTAGAGMPSWLRPIRSLLFSAPEVGAGRLAAGAFDPGMAGRSGVYVQRGKVRALPEVAADPARQAALLAWCAASTGIGSTNAET